MIRMNAEQREKFDRWQEEQEEKARKKQGKPEGEKANYGAIGGAYTYMLTPTSLGTIFKVRHNVTEEEIDLTDYMEW